MDFPAHVPAAVRAHITTLIEGDQREPHGYAASLANAEQHLSEIEQKIEARTSRGENEDLNKLRQQRIDAVKHRGRLAGIVDCLHRLAHDSRMLGAFGLLTTEFSDDEQWRGFVYAAWAARMDYAPYRERLKTAAELKEEIVETADKLAKLIRQFKKLGVNGPGEFYSVPDLLRKTDNHELQERDLYGWRAMRKHLLGDRQELEPEPNDQPELDLPPSESDRVIEVDGVTVHLPNIRFVSPGDPVEPDPLADLRSAWQVSPPFSALLETVAKVARDFQPSEYGMIGAAIDSRQHSEKTEYLRAFASLLTNVHHLTLTPVVMKAMAIVATVVINMPEVDVTYDDVRKGVAKLG